LASVAILQTAAVPTAAVATVHATNTADTIDTPRISPSPFVQVMVQSTPDSTEHAPSDLQLEARQLNEIRHHPEATHLRNLSQSELNDYLWQCLHHYASDTSILVHPEPLPERVILRQCSFIPPLLGAPDLHPPAAERMLDEVMHDPRYKLEDQLQQMAIKGAMLKIIHSILQENAEPHYQRTRTTQMVASMYFRWAVRKHEAAKFHRDRYEHLAIRYEALKHRYETLQTDHDNLRQRQRDARAGVPCRGRDKRALAASYIQ
jgi:hypothetical protein